MAIYLIVSSVSFHTQAALLIGYLCTLLQPFLISFTQINQIHFQSVAVYAYQQSVLRLKRHTL